MLAVPIMLPTLVAAHSSAAPPKADSLVVEEHGRRWEYPMRDMSLYQFCQWLQATGRTEAAPETDPEANERIAGEVDARSSERWYPLLCALARQQNRE